MNSSRIAERAPPSRSTANLDGGDNPRQLNEVNDAPMSLLPLPIPVIPPHRSSHDTSAFSSKNSKNNRLECLR